MTSKGKHLYQSNRDEFLHKLNISWKKVQRALNSLANQETGDDVKNVITSYDAYCSLSKKYLEFLERSNAEESEHDKEIHHTEVSRHKSIVDNALQQPEEAKTMAHASVHKPISDKSSGSHSRSSRHSKSISDVSRKRAKAEAAKARITFVEKQAVLKKQKALLEVDLDVLQAKEEAAAAEAEADALESIAGIDKQSQVIGSLPTQKYAERTREYVQTVFNSHVDEFAGHPPIISVGLDINAPQFNPVPTDRIIEVPQQLSAGDNVSSELTRFLLKKELLFSRLTNFSDKPETYPVWKHSFLSVMNELSVTSKEEIDLLVRWLGPESTQHAISLRASNATNPCRGVKRIWDRLDERYGSPEMIEAALKDKLNNFTKITNKDFGKLYELSDILEEIESNMENHSYRDLLAYFNSSSGIAPIVAKLPYGMQEKWTSHAFRYKQQHRVPYPPFTFFTQVFRELSKMKNDPGLNYEMKPPVKDAEVRRPERTRITPKRNSGSSITTLKTDTQVGDESPSLSNGTLCPIHNTGHSLNECRSFKSKPIALRKKFLREKGICYKCCDGKDHRYSSCQKNIRCSICNSEMHPAALHIDGGEGRQHHAGSKERSPPVVNSRCTAVCGDGFSGKSCAKVILVTVFPKGKPHQALRLYAMMDDQRNRTMANPEFFDFFEVKGNTESYALATCSGKVHTSGRTVSNLIVESLDRVVKFDIPSIIECHELPNARDEIPTPEVVQNYPHLRDVHVPPLDKDAKISLLIGRDIASAHHVLEQRVSPKETPYAQRLPLGWTIVGETCLGKIHKMSSVNVRKTHILKDGRVSLFKPCPNDFDVHEQESASTLVGCTSAALNTAPERDSIGREVFRRNKDDEKDGTSVEDREFIKLMEEEFVRQCDGHWTAPLPFRSGRPRLPNNRAQAAKRAKTLDSNLRRDQLKRDHFKVFMGGIFKEGHAELAPPLQEGEECWYLPLFGVYHPKKKDQIRGVFDSSSKHMGISLNDVLLKGPDLTNSLLGILLRFRKEPVAMLGDIRQLFYCFSVKEAHRNFLRFLWYEDNDFDKDLVDYRMTVHVFGNTPSPAVATYGLRKAVQNADPDVQQFVERDFYVDDGLKSSRSTDQAVDLMKRTQEALMEGGRLRLHKIVSNFDDVMEAFPQEDLAKGIKILDLGADPLPMQRSLGISWSLDTDTFSFQVSPDDKPFTKRGILSTINSIFDPIGFLAPVVIEGRQLMRMLLPETEDWDTPLPTDRKSDWDHWRRSLKNLEQLQIPRTYIPASWNASRERSIHIFCDASEKAVAAVGYLKAEGTAEIGFIMGKAKLAPIHGHTVPRLELCAAVLAVEIGEFISEHLDTPLEELRFYTDSRVVLGYIQNQSRRFRTYVSNRVARIRNSTEPHQWYHVPTEKNPADQGTRSLHSKELPGSTWLQGPARFLEEELGHQEAVDVSEDDVEIIAHKTEVTGTTVLGTKRYERFSSLNSLIKAIASLKNFAKRYSSRKLDVGNDQRSGHSMSLDYGSAQKLVLQQVQREAYSKEFELLQIEKPLRKDCKILALNPYLDEDGFLRVGGRLNNAEIGFEEKHPMLIPGWHHIATLIVRHYHAQIHHQGRHLTEGAIRAAGFWLTGGKRLISSVIHKCVTCRRLRGKEEIQIMSDLPVDRLKPGPPFTSVGVDTFGPWSIITRRTRGGAANSKRWAILFTCLTTSKAMTHEVLTTLMAEVCAIVNARPLVPISTDPEDPNILSPAMLLTQKYPGCDDGLLIISILKTCSKHSGDTSRCWQKHSGSVGAGITC